MSGKIFVVTPTKAVRSCSFLFLVLSDEMRVGLGFLDHCVSGSDFCSAKSRARILQTNSSLGLGFLNQGLGVSARLGFYHSPPLVFLSLLLSLIRSLALFIFFFLVSRPCFEPTRTRRYMVKDCENNFL